MLQQWEQAGEASKEKPQGKKPFTKAFFGAPDANSQFQHAASLKLGWNQGVSLSLDAKGESS